MRSSPDNSSDEGLRPRKISRAAAVNERERADSSLAIVDLRERAVSDLAAECADRSESFDENGCESASKILSLPSDFTEILNFVSKT